MATDFGLFQMACARDMVMSRGTLVMHFCHTNRRSSYSKFITSFKIHMRRRILLVVALLALAVRPIVSAPPTWRTKGVAVTRSKNLHAMLQKNVSAGRIPRRSGNGE